MKVYQYPSRDKWAEILQRPVFDNTALKNTVTSLIEDIKQNGDAALRKYTKQFNEADIKNFLVSGTEIDDAEKIFLLH